ncbi:hypothetical protein [Phycicoccus avicenniae]|uniref:hypothetical protein n=1 Tax=Phycicoccus avicenniae TaxID=2828860 RepID=UPI003D2A2574
MTTTAARPAHRVHPVPTARHDLRAPAPGARVRAAATRRPAVRTAGLALAAGLGSLALSVPAVAQLDGLGSRSSGIDVVASFLVVAVLEVVLARTLWTLTRDRARPAAWAALLARTGYALLVAVGAVLLLAQGDAGAEAFRGHWSDALGVLGLHLVAAAVALRQSGLAGRIGSTAMALCGALALVAGLLPGTDPALTTVLVPAVTGEALLAAALGRAVLPGLGGRTRPEIG